MEQLCAVMCICYVMYVSFVTLCQLRMLVELCYVSCQMVMLLVMYGVVHDYGSASALRRNRMSTELMSNIVFLRNNTDAVTEMGS